MASSKTNKTILDNGLTIVTEKIDSVKSVSAGIWVKTGSRNETDAQAGVTHFLEHMLFKGTEKRSSYDIALSMESVGGFLNAFTSSEYTCYYARCLSSQLPRALDVLSDMVLHPTFPEDEMEKEKKVVIEEMKMYRDSPRDYLFEKFNAQIFKENSLGRPVIGYEETVNSFERANLYDYMKDRYQPDNLLIAVAGDVEHEKAVSLAQEHFEKVQTGETQNGRSELSHYKPGNQMLSKAIEQTHFIIGKRGLSFDDDDKYRLLITNAILGGGMSSRLHQNVREKYGYCYTIGSFNQTFSDTGLYGIYTGTDIDYVEHVEELVKKELKRLQDEAVPQKELDEAKAQLKGKLLLSLENTSNRMRRIAKGELYYGRFISVDELTENIEAIDAAEIQEFSQSFFDEAQFSKAILKPE
ncbi:MAG TPA: pitrilysin family protein [Balneolaceae bacterium]|nr:pitrilysin family protein [Balneolaceae bacterium]